ncbi:MAG: PKD domain-containing protein [Ferruginibacter sp.]
MPDYIKRWGNCIEKRFYQFGKIMMSNRTIIIKTLFAVIAFLGGLQLIYAQNISNRGKDFWVGYGHHQYMEPTITAPTNNSQNMVLYFSAEQAATVTVTIKGITVTTVQTYNVPANSVVVSLVMPKTGTNDVRLFDLPPTFCPSPPSPSACYGGERIFSRSIHIESTVPIVAYAHIYSSVSSGATMLLPTESWGYAYTSMNSQQTQASGAAFSWFYVVAKENNTRISITPTAISRNGRPAGVTFDTTLNKGDIYQHVATSDPQGNGPQFTGSTIKSIANASGECFPIAVFSGSSRTMGEAAVCGSSGRDNDMQQCFPQQAWGKKYLTAPFSSSNGSTLLPTSFQTSVYKVAVKDPTTVVKLNGTVLSPATLINGSYYQFSNNTANVLESDKPVMVGQFISGGSACNPGSSGDPEMVFLSPVEQSIKRVSFYRNNQTAIFSNYVTVVIPTSGVTSLRIDGSAVFNHTYPHPNAPGYTVVVKGWSAAQAQSSMLSDSGFTAITYGLGSAESYAYNAGTFLNNLNAIGSIFNTNDTTGTTTSHPFTCTNTPVQLSVLIAYQPTKLVWQLSQVGPVLSPNADVINNAPVSTGTVIIGGITYYKYTLPGNYNFSASGTYTIPILATHPSIENCNNTEALSYSVLVNAKPAVDFSYTHSGCILDPVQFNGPSATGNGYALNQWLWTFPGPVSANTQNPAHTFTTTGNQSVKLQVVTAQGCVSDTIKTVPIFPKPVTTISASAPSVCEGGAITFTGTTIFGGSGPVNNFYWNFGNGTANTAGPHTVTYNTYGTYTVKHTAGVSNACISDTAQTVVTVYAKPTTSFSYPAGCLPASGTVQFTSNATTPDGQAISAYLWNFGDPASGPLNTSTLANPTHTYPGFGTYTITFSVTTANGCTKDTSVVATFNLSPTFSYPPLAPVCESVTGTVSVASASVTNGVPGTGTYSGPATTPAGLFTPSAAGAGTHTIWYVYAATSGCTDSVSQTITVYPKPAPNFSIPTASCLPVGGNVQFNYTGSLSPGQTYAWNFGDPASGPLNTSTLQNPTHNYTTGTYSISLTVTTTQGCVEDTFITRTFAVRPALAYPALVPVCQSITGTVSVATATVTNSVGGSGIYSGPGTNAAGNFTPSIAGAGTHTIWYIFTATGNCVDSISQTITVYPKPTASFTYPTACLPSSGLAQFTYNGTVAGSFLWNFGDPGSGGLNTSTLQNPTHNYITAGTYTITLTVTDGNTCTDDTSITTTFNLKPALNYPPLAPVCESAPGTISVATATVTNGVSGTGVYSGPGTNAAGIFNPAVAGGGTHTIWYIFTATGNCMDSISSTITVGSKPNASFTSSPAGCLPVTGLVQFTYNGSVTGGETYLWNFNDPNANAGNPNTSTLPNPTHNYTNTGTYNVLLTVTGSNGCTDDTTITSTFSVTPALAYPALSPVCEGASNVSVATATVTNGVAGTGVYSGPGTNAAGIFNPAVAGAGTHSIVYTFTSTGGCTATISTTILVNPKPNASFTISPAGCLPATGQVQFTYNGSVTAGQTYAWNFGDPASGPLNTSTLQNPTHNYTNTGTYNVQLTVTGSNTCTDDTIITRIFSVTPALAYPPLSPVCEGASNVSVATATVTNGVTGTGVYSGPGTDAAGNFNPLAAGPGTHTIVYTFTSSGGCTATISNIIMVNPKPNASFTISPSGCLPTTGQVQFTYNGSITAGQTYLWNFNDPNANAGNPNTSTSQNPTHNYTNTGTYNVQLTVTGSNTCTDDTTITAVFSVTPQLVFGPLSAPVCENVATVSVATASVTNGVTGTGVYSGPGTNAAGIFTSSIAGPGLHTITYTFTSTGGCTATAQRQIMVNPKPSSVIVAPTDICLNQAVLLSSNSTIATGNITTWNWTFGDGNTGSYTNGNPFIHPYTTFGNYTVQLVTVSDSGCTSTPAQKVISIHAMPVTNFNLPASVCLPGGIATFKNTTTVADNSSLSYQWDFGDLTPGSSATDASHVYAANASYNVRLTATTSFGCTNDKVKTFSAFFDKPVANFSATPDKLCQGVSTVFNDLSSAPNSSILSRLWIFGDGTTSSDVNPVKTYRDSGTYNVKLVVKSQEGCISDTFSYLVTVYQQPVIDAGPSFVVPQGTMLQFKAVSNSTLFTYMWSPAIGLSDNTVLNPMLQANNDATYILTATGNGNCTATDQLTVKILKPVKIPNAFSPNGDGSNDTWQLDNLKDYPGATVQVFNRYGQLVYNTVSYTSPWDGTMKGKPLPVATYYYIIDLKNGFKPLNGSITLIR